MNIIEILNYLNDNTESLLVSTYNATEDEEDLRKLSKSVKKKYKVNSSDSIKLITQPTKFYEVLDKDPAKINKLASLMAQYADLSSYIVRIPQVISRESLYTNCDLLVFHNEEEVKRQLARVEAYKKKLMEEQEEFSEKFDRQRNKLKMLIDRLNNCSSEVLDMNLFENYVKEKQSQPYDSLLEELHRKLNERSKLQKKIIKSRQVRDRITNLGYSIGHIQTFMYNEMIGSIITSLNFKIDVPENFEKLNIDLLFGKQKAWYHARNIENTKFASDLMCILADMEENKSSEEVIDEKIRILAELRKSMGLLISNKKMIKVMQAWDYAVLTNIFSLNEEENVSTIRHYVEELKNTPKQKNSSQTIEDYGGTKPKVNTKKLHIS